MLKSTHRVTILCVLYLMFFLAGTSLVSSADNVTKASTPFVKIDLTAEEQAWLHAHPEISVAVKHGYSPIEFIFELQEFRGVSVDYLKKLEILLGIKFNKTIADQNVAKIDADMLSSVPNPASLEGTRFAALNEPFLISPIAIFTKKGSHKLDGIDDLRGKKVAVFKTAFIAKKLAEDHPEIQLYLVDIAEEALDAVQTGKVDAYVGSSVIIKYVLKNADVENIEFAANTPYNSKIYMAVRSDWPIFSSILSKALGAITQQEKDEILDKWTKMSYTNKVNYELIGSIMLVFILILSVFYISNRRLKNEVKQRITLETSLIQSKVQAEQAEETIRRYAKDLERLAMVAKHTTDSVIITDVHGLTIWVNQAFINTTGFTLEDMLGKKPGTLLQGPETAQESISLMHDAIQNFADVEVELINYKKNGEKHWIDLKISSIVNSLGERVFIAIQTDITRQVNYIKAIKSSQEDMDALFSLSPDGVVVLDSERRISHVNESFAALIGMPRERLLGLTESSLDDLIKSICAEPRDYKSVDALTYAEAKADMQPGMLTGAARKEFKFQITSPAVKTLERYCIETNQKRISRVFYFKDVTEKVLLENMKSEFITTAAHELRTPMSVILGYSELLKIRRFDAAIQLEMIDAIHAKSSLVATLLDDLLDVAVIEYRAEKTLKLELQSIVPFITSIAETFIFPRNNNRVLLDEMPSVPDFYYDSQRLERAINNCLTNAYKFSSSTGIVKMRCYFSKSDESEFVIEIEDQGIGMNPEQLSRIFEKFYRADRSGHVPGTGLGMVLVKDILEAHGGRVHVESEQDVGTKVSLILPVRQSID